MRPDCLVLKGVTFACEGGKTTALVGRSGSGKTTMLSLMLRFYDVRSGTIRLDGRPVKSINVLAMRKLFGVVQQDTQLFAKSMRDNITYGLEEGEFTDADVERAATLACAHDFIMEMPDGYNTRAGEAGCRLSGGQRQRISIARCLIRQPKILLLDEATSALDAESEAHVQAALDTLMGGTERTVVLVAHRLSTVIDADKIAVVNKGEIVEEGDHTSLLQKEDGIYAALVSRQIARQMQTITEASAGAQAAQADDIDKLVDDMQKAKEAKGAAPAK